MLDSGKLATLPGFSMDDAAGRRQDVRCKLQSCQI